MQVQTPVLSLLALLLALLLLSLLYGREQCMPTLLFFLLGGLMLGLILCVDLSIGGVLGMWWFILSTRW